ncbi:unnamed protein product [Camellia sinensis]
MSQNCQQNLELSKMEPTQVVVKGTVEYVRSCCEASLKRLGVDYIDLYYVHWIYTSGPIEETIEELKKLVEDGKIKYIGLSEASPNTIRRAHDVHPITALQMEYSLWTRDIEEEIIPLCRFHIPLLLMGFFAGKAVVESVPTDSFLLALSRFIGQNLDHNKISYLRIEELSKKHSCTLVQLVLAWVLHQGDDTVPIPGTTKIKNLDENIGALRVKLTEDDLKEIFDLVPILKIAGPRIYKSFTRASRIFLQIHHCQRIPSLVVALVVATAAETRACLDVFRWCQARDIQFLSQIAYGWSNSFVVYHHAIGPQNC